MKDITLMILTSPLWVTAILLIVLADILLIPLVFIRNTFTDGIRGKYFGNIKLALNLD